MSSVQNVKVANIRPKYNNLKEWVEDEMNVYIGRRGIVFINGERFPKTDSKWHNPFKITAELSREESLRKYHVYITQKVESGELDLKELSNKALGCWCFPNTCHGDILLEMCRSNDI
jgi:Domain of unknown function (DUF4326)